MDKITAFINLGCSDSEDELPTPIPEKRRVTRSSSRRKQPYNIRRRGDTPVSEVIERAVKVLKKKKTLVLEDGLEISIDDMSDEEVEQCITVIWGRNAELNRFFLKQSDSLKSIYESLSRKYLLPIENIKIRNGDTVLSMHMTVESLQLRVTSYLQGYRVQETPESCRTNATGKIKIKCLLQDTKKPLLFYLYPQQDFNCVLEECSKEIGTSTSKLTLKFDGEKVFPSETPTSLDLEGDECFEIHVIS